MKNSTKKIFATILVVVLMLVPTLAMASSITPGSIKPNATGTANVLNIGQSIVGILQVIGIIASVAVLIILGIKYMMGSTEEKAEYKKTLLPYLIGAVLIFGASTFAQKIYDWATTAFN